MFSSNIQGWKSPPDYNGLIEAKNKDSNKDYQLTGAMKVTLYCLGVIILNTDYIIPYCILLFADTTFWNLGKMNTWEKPLG